MENGKHEGHVPGGYIILARKLEDSEVWSQDHHHLRLWIYLLLKARWKDEPEQRGPVTIQRGQVLKSYRVLSEENQWIENQRVRKWSLSRVGRMLAWLEENEMIATHGTDLGTLITVHNFNKYQHPGAYGLDYGTDLGTGSGRVRDNKKKGNKEKNPSLPYPPDVMEVFSYWRERRSVAIGKTSGPPMTATKTRLSKIQARLREGYTVDQLQAAVDGCLSNPRNIEGGYTDLELICRDQAHVEQYRTWKRNGPPGGQARPKSGALDLPDLRKMEAA